MNNKLNHITEKTMKEINEVARRYRTFYNKLPATKKHSDPNELSFEMIHQVLSSFGTELSGHFVDFVCNKVDDLMFYNKTYRYECIAKGDTTETKWYMFLYHSKSDLVKRFGDRVVVDEKGIMVNDTYLYSTLDGDVSGILINDANEVLIIDPITFLNEYQISLVDMPSKSIKN
jgi:hypothetical protein